MDKNIIRMGAENMNEEKKQKVASIGTPYAKEQYVKFQKQQRQLIFRRRRLAAVIAIAGVIFTIMSIQIFHEHQRLNNLESIKEKTQVEAKKVDHRVSTLKHDVALLENDDYVEKLARSRYYYSKKGELIFVLPENKTTPTTDNSQNEIIKSETTKK